jgi:hypothetical protein
MNKIGKQIQKCWLMNGDGLIFISRGWPTNYYGSKTAAANARSTAAVCGIQSNPLA